MKNIKKTGPITLALGLIFFGVVMLASNITGTGLWESVLKYWPALLIGLGLEYFIKSFVFSKTGSGEEVGFHFPTVIIVLLITLFAFVGQQAAQVMRNQDLSGLFREAVAGNAFNYSYVYQGDPVAVKPGVTKVQVDNRVGNVEMQASNDGLLHVEARITGWGSSEAEAKQRAEAVKINVREGNVVKISCSPEGRFNGRRRADVTYRLAVPEGVDLAVTTESGEVKADGLTSNIEVDNENGNVYLGDIRGNVVFNGKHGEFKSSNVTGTLDATLVSGNIIITDPAKDVRVTNENGNVELTFTKPVESNVFVINRNGEIVCRVPENSDTKLTAQTNSGTISGTFSAMVDKSGINNVSDSEGSKNRDLQEGTAAVNQISGVLGTGKGSISLNLVNGNIIVDKI